MITTVEHTMTTPSRAWQMKGGSVNPTAIGSRPANAV
jgi:hypothetical protein